MRFFYGIDVLIEVHILVVSTECVQILEVSSMLRPWVLQPVCLLSNSWLHAEHRRLVHSALVVASVNLKFDIALGLHDSFVFHVRLVEWKIAHYALVRLYPFQVLGLARLAWLYSAPQGALSDKLVILSLVPLLRLGLLLFPLHLLKLNLRAVQRQVLRDPLLCKDQPLHVILEVLRHVVDRLPLDVVDMVLQRLQILRLLHTATDGLVAVDHQCLLLGGEHRFIREAHQVVAEQWPGVHRVKDLFSFFGLARQRSVAQEEHALGGCDIDFFRPVVCVHREIKLGIRNSVVGGGLDASKLGWSHRDVGHELE